MKQYRTLEGDTLDKICLNFYGRSHRYVEAVLVANPGLATLGPIFSAGIIIELPDLPELKENKRLVRLWD